jgi:hypothetical protein
MKWFQTKYEELMAGRQTARSTSCLFACVTSKKFEFFSVLVIFVNTGVLIYSTDRMMRRALDGEQASDDMDAIVWCEVGFVTWYAIELILKVIGTGVYFFTDEDRGWNILDLVLVGLSVTDMLMTRVFDAELGNIGVLRAMRFLRVIRVVRMFRVMRFVNELRTLLSCVLGCLNPMIWACVLIAFFLVMFSVFFVQTAATYIQDSHGTYPVNLEDYKQFFGSVPVACLTLFQGISGGRDWGEVYEMVHFSPASSIMFIILVLFFQLAVLNIVTSIFVEKALSCAKPDNERLILLQNQKDIQDAKELIELVKSIDQDHSGAITFEEFQQFMDDERFRLYFEVRNIDLADAEMFFELLVAGSSDRDILEDEEEGDAGGLLAGKVDLGTFVDGCFRLKGSASSMDLRCLDFELKLMHAHQERFFQFCSHQFHKIFSAIEPHESHHKTVYQSAKKKPVARSMQTPTPVM